MDNEYLIPPVKFADKGRPLKYTPKELAEKFVEYVEWCKNNPIILGTEVKNTSVDGREYGNTTKEMKPRLVSVAGFLVFIGESSRWWGELNDSKRQDFSVVKALIREYCEAFQKEMAANNIFNGNIISRLLGLADKQQVETTAPINVSLDSEKAVEGLKAALASGAAPRKPKDE